MNLWKRRICISKSEFIAATAVLIIPLLFLSCGYLAGWAPSFSEPSKSLDKIKLPSNFKISVLANNINGARSLTSANDFLIFVGSRSEGKIYALIDEDKNYKTDQIITLASGLNSPNGVAYYKGDLYVAEIQRVIVFRNIKKQLHENAKFKVINATFPDKEQHGWKYIAFGPDGSLYVPIGMPCNICNPDDSRFGTIMRMKPDGSDLEVYAKGIRNTVGFDWHPETKNLWFTDNGRDWMGDNKPPDELNVVEKKGEHFGFPFCHGKRHQDPKFDSKKCSSLEAPELVLGPHVAALGMKFYTGKQFPKKYHGVIFIAEHGSWNRTTPIGYRVMFVPMKNSEPQGYEVFAEGWLDGVTSWGRPVDIWVMQDGSLLVSDDKGDAVYRISH